MSLFIINNVCHCSVHVKMWFILCFRFDLIFLILDPQHELYDRRLANHLVSLYYITEEQQQQEFLVNGVKVVIVLHTKFLDWHCYISDVETLFMS